MKTIMKTEFKRTEIGMIPEDWEVDKLEDHLVIKGRIGWKGLQISEYTDVGPFIVGGLQIKENSIEWEECAHVTKARYEESPEIMLRESDILMTKDGTIGKLAYVTSLPDKATVASHIHVIRNKSGKVLPRFLFYFFKSPRFQNLVESKISGSVVPALTQKDINDTGFPLPPLPEQQSIAKILSDLDSKIELNEQMDKTLEGVGRAIFKHWFVDFEFPNEEGKPYKSSGGEMIYNEELGKEIPKGWKVGKLGEICKIVMGQSPPGDTYNEIGEGMPFFQGVKDYGFRFPSRRVFCISPTRLAERGDILLSVRAPIGSLNIADERCCIGRGLASIRHGENYQSFLYYLLVSTKGNWISFEAEGTVFGAVTKSDVNEFSIVVPPKELQAKFNSVVGPADAKVQLNEKESSSLRETRDSLLPKLMSGKIRVPVEVR